MDIRNLLKAPASSVEVSTRTLGEALSALDEATCYMAMLVGKKFDELGVATLDEAAETSPEYCNLVYLQDLVESAELLLERALSKALVKG
jgi:hypothetical protein